jgi:hypothetical protein
MKIEVLSFTHFGFIQNKLPTIEIRSILEVLLDKKNKSSLRVLIWDIDLRHRVEMIKIFKEMQSKN